MSLGSSGALGREGLDPDQMAQLALRTEWEPVQGGVLRDRHGWSHLAGRWGSLRRSQQGPRLLQIGRGLGAPQAVATDLDKAFWQDVSEKASDKLFSAKGHSLQLLGTIIPVAEGDLSVLERFDAAVGDRDPKHVAAQIIEGLLSGTGVSAMHHPILLPNPSRHLSQQPRPFQTGLEFAPKDLAQSKAGHQEGGVLWIDPVLASGREPAGAHQ